MLKFVLAVLVACSAFAEDKPVAAAATPIFTFPSIRESIIV
jgi:hypothetical protein